MRCIFIIFLFIVSSCTKVHDLEKKNGIYYLSKVKTEIKEVKHVPWQVGLKREIEVSRGVRLSITVPIISDSTKHILYQKHGVDSWVYRFNRKRRGRKDPIGHVFYHFNNISSSTKAFTLNIYYHASSVSNRFRYFHCPAFDHRLHLQNVALSSRKTSRQEDIYVRAMPNVKSKVERLGFTPLIFSAGRSMFGEYEVDFALYNSKTKQRFSRWFPVAKMLNITNEVRRTVSSCTGIKEETNPLPSSAPLDIRNLEIN
jgi:hypothetical protein